MGQDFDRPVIHRTASAEDEQQRLVAILAATSAAQKRAYTAASDIPQVHNITLLPAMKF